MIKRGKPQRTPKWERFTTVTGTNLIVGGLALILSVFYRLSALR